MQLSLFFLLILFNFGKPVPREIEGFAKEVVQSFKNKNFEQYKKLCTKPEDLTNEILPAIKKDTLHIVPEGIIQQAIEFDESYNDSTRKIIFQRYLSQGEKLGIAWNEINFEEVEFEKRVIRKPGDNTLSCHIRFSYKGQSYFLFGVMAVHLKRGYCLTYISHVFKK